VPSKKKKKGKKRKRGEEIVHQNRFPQERLAFPAVLPLKKKKRERGPLTSLSVGRKETTSVTVESSARVPREGVLRLPSPTPPLSLLKGKGGEEGHPRTIPQYKRSNPFLLASDCSRPSQ